MAGICYSARVPSALCALAAQSPSMRSPFVRPSSRLCYRLRKTTSSSELLEEEPKRAGNKWSELIQLLLSRRWLLQQPSTKISRILVSSSSSAVEEEDPGVLGQVRFGLQEDVCTQGSRLDVNPSFYVIRDDLLHPLLGGNKLRKLDALLPQLEDCLQATDLLTCGGCQSAHTAAMAFACAERGIRAHLLLRGEKPSIPTGYNLLSGMYGQNIFVPRSEYADRSAMLRKHAIRVAGTSGSIMWLDEIGNFVEADGKSSGKKRVVVVKEGAGVAVALLGLIRLVHYLSQPSIFGSVDHLQIVVDSGTGTTAVGLALGVLLLELPWKVTGVTLAGTIESYEGHQSELISGFCRQYSFSLEEGLQLPLSWIHRWKPRKFGNILPGEVRACQSVAQQTGILLDPIYTLAGWEAATRISLEEQGTCKVVMLHTGGTLGLFGLAQRYPAEFS